MQNDFTNMLAWATRISRKSPPPTPRESLQAESESSDDSFNSKQEWKKVSDHRLTLFGAKDRNSNRGSIAAELRVSRGSNASHVEQEVEETEEIKFSRQSSRTMRISLALSEPRFSISDTKQIRLRKLLIAGTKCYYPMLKTKFIKKHFMILGLLLTIQKFNVTKNVPLTRTRGTMLVL